MAHPTAVILIVGLNDELIDMGAERLRQFRAQGERTWLQPVLPAVTCSVQSSMLTGKPIRDHGVVGNGWYNADLAEVQFWKQPDRLVQAEKVWETARRRDPAVTTAKMFWWYNMYSTAEYSVTPRPIYKADGRKLPDVYSNPPELRERLQRELGSFPLFKFWGPGAAIESSAWIAEASMRVHQWHAPTLNLVYLPHLDYALQKYGPTAPEIPAAVAEIDSVFGRLLDYYATSGVRVLVVSEYGIETVTSSASPNRVLRAEGLCTVRTEQGGELLDAGASRAFAVADHQIAHVYVREQADCDSVAQLCREIEAVEAVLDKDQQRELGIDHPRGGDLVLVARAQRWFDYYYWDSDSAAPDFARTVDIHRKPGYDPCELFMDPQFVWPTGRVLRRVLQKKLGMRMLMDVIPLDPGLVRGSHGRIDQPVAQQPVMIANRACTDGSSRLPCTAVRDAILAHLFDD